MTRVIRVLKNRWSKQLPAASRPQATTSPASRPPHTSPAFSPCLFNLRVFTLAMLHVTTLFLTINELLGATITNCEITLLLLSSPGFILVSQASRNLNFHMNEANNKMAVTIKPNDNDVLSGRGAWFNQHPGNGHFRRMLDEQKVSDSNFFISWPSN